MQPVTTPVENQHNQLPSSSSSNSTVSSRYSDALQLKNDKHYEAAIRIFFDLAAEQHHESQYQIGIMFRDGLGIKQNYAVAEAWFEKAGRNGIADASNALGELYLDGLLDPLRGEPNHNQLALQNFEKAANKGCADAYYNLAYMYQHGTGVDQSNELALEMLQHSAQHGSAAACNKIGYVYLNGLLSVEKNYAMAVKWFLDAIKLGSVNAYNNIGWMHVYGLGVSKNYHMALSYFKEAADRGSGSAYNNIGWLQLHSFIKNTQGKDVVKSFELAIEKGAASAGYNNIGFMYLHGLKVTKDIRTAKRHFELAIDEEFVEPTVYENLGYMYLYDCGIKTDHDLAMYYFKLAVDNGLTMTNYYIGAMYLAYLAKPTDVRYTEQLEKVIHHLVLAANAGSAKACRQLNNIYRSGQYMEKNEAIADKWLRLAARC